MPMAGQFRARLARLGRYRHADERIPGGQLLDDLVAQIVLGPHQPVALRTRSLPVQHERGREVRSVKQRHRVVFAAQLRCQAQFTAVHGTELGIQHSGYSTRYLHQQGQCNKGRP